MLAPVLNLSTPTLPIRTERLILRGVMIDDLDDVHAFRRLPEVARYLYRPPNTLEVTREMVEKSAALTFDTDGDALSLGITEHHSTRVIGEVVLMLRSVAAGQAEVGYVLHPDAAGHGYATEASRAMVALAFSHFGFHRVFARLDAENTASAAVCRKLGMRHEATLIENDVRDGELGTELIFAVLQREWQRSGG